MFDRFLAQDAEDQTRPRMPAIARGPDGDPSEVSPQRRLYVNTLLTAGPSQHTVDTMFSKTRRPAPRTRSMGRLQLTSAMPIILLGLLCYALSSAFEGGFLRGFFQGATIALMILGAYLAGAGLWFSRTDDEGSGEARHWLPSRDGRGDGSC